MNIAARRLPEFLGPSHEPSLRMRCPIHGLIPFSPVERKIIDHRLFQRLRRIKQLAFCYYVYPGATHTRFEHSIGVMHFCTRAFDRLLSRHADLMQKTFEQVPEFGKDKTLAKARQLVRLLGLTHDLGHTPFSHAGEIILEQGHENLSAMIVREEDLLGSLIDNNFFEGASSLLERILDKTKEAEVPPQVRLLQKIFSAQLDFDRADYLLRDAHHCGVEYGRYDQHQLVDCLTLDTDPDTGELDICVTEDGVHAFEALILARYQMTLQVYAHKVRRIYDYYLKNYLKDWAEERIEGPLDALDWDDYSVFRDLMSDAQSSLRRSSWAARIVQREHHREIHRSRPHIDTQEEKKLKSVRDKLLKEYTEVDFVFDVAKGWVHKLYVPGEMEQEKIEDLFVLEGPDRHRASIGEVSKVLSKIPRLYRIGRIVAGTTDRALRDEMERRVTELLR